MVGSQCSKRDRLNTHSKVNNFFDLPQYSALSSLQFLNLLMKNNLGI